VLVPSNVQAQMQSTEWAEFASHQQSQQQQTQPNDPWAAGSKLFNLDSVDKKPAASTTPQSPTLGAMIKQTSPQQSLAMQQPMLQPQVQPSPFTLSPTPAPATTTYGAPAAVGAAPQQPTYVVGPNGQTYILTPAAGGGFALAPVNTVVARP